MKKLFLTVLLLLHASLALAAFDFSAELIARESLISAATSVSTDPNADLLLVDDQTKIRYETDGTSYNLYDTAFKILTEKGRQEKSSIHIGYSTDYGTMHFVRAEIIKPDGTLVAIDLTSQSREAIDQGQMAANIYDPSQKSIILTVPGLETGDILRYTVASKNTKTVVPNSWSDLFILEETFPILHAVYTVDAPAALPLQRIELKDEIPGTVTYQTEPRGDRILYTWEANNVPRMFEEPDMPQPYTVAQRVLLSTIPDWETLSKWYWELSKPRLEAVTPAMQAKVSQLTADCPAPQQKIEALFRFVSQDVRYMGITVENEAPGYEPHDVSLTFDNRYGVCRDKAALLVAMLRIAGFDARPVLIYVGPKKDPEVPQPWFNHAITAVKNADGSWQLMDATNENTRDLLPAYLSYRSYLVATPDGETLQTSPVVPPEKNLLTIQVDATLDESRLITGRAVLSFDGINDTAYRGRLAALKPGERDPYFETRLKQALGAARLTRLKIRPDPVRDTTVPLSVTLDFEIENALAEDDTNALLQAPTLINQFGLFGRIIGGGIGLDRRRYPLYTELTCGVTETVRLDLSQSGLKPAALPAYETIDTPELYISRSVETSNDLLISRADILLRTVEFSPEQYLTLKQNLKASERNARKRILLERSGFPSGADLATLSETVQYTLYDPFNWTEDRTVRQQVLSYAGKKQLSDLQFIYNPTNQTTVLSSATVTAPNGKVQYIDPDKEVNIMDAAWSGTAPRYPAEKIMVANLPGVEIGSIIEYRVITVNRGLPFFSTTEYFADFNPLNSKTVRVILPLNMHLNIILNDPAAIQQRTSILNGRTVHEWNIKKRSTIKTEENLPPDWTFRPAIILSCGDLNDYASWVEKTLLQAQDQDQAAKEKAPELPQKTKGRLQKITVLRDFVDRTIQEAGPGLPFLPLSAVTPADQVLQEGYGNTTDRAVLLYAMLNAAGLKPRFILASSLPRINGVSAPLIDSLQRTAFDTVLVAVNDDDKQPLYLGDSSQYAQPGTLTHTEQPAIDLKEEEIILPQTALTNAVSTDFVLTLSENGDAELTKKTLFYGISFEQFHRQFVQFTPEERDRAHQNLLSQLSQSAEAVGDLKTSFTYPGELQLSARLPAFAVRDGDHIYFTLPEHLGDLLNLKTSRRNNAFCIDQPVNETYSYTITLPAGWEPVLLPERFHTDLPSDAGFVTVNVYANDNKLRIQQHAELNAAIIPATDYSKLLLLNDQLTGPSARTILLQKKPTPADPLNRQKTRKNPLSR